MLPDTAFSMPAAYPVPVSYRFFTASPVGSLEYRHVKSSVVYQTQKFLVPSFYKTISRCVPPLSL